MNKPSVAQPEVSRFSQLFDRRFYTIMAVLMAALITDYLISNIADIVSEQLKSSAGFALFIVVSVISILGQLYLLRALKEVVNKKNKKQPVKFSLQKLVEAIQYLLIIILIITIFQIIFTLQYFTSILIISTTVSYGLTATIMGTLAWKMLIWFKRSKNLALLLYSFGTIVIIFNAISSIILFDSILMEKPETVSRESEVIFNLGSEPGTSKFIVVTSQSYSYIVYFLFIWGGTIMILRHNIKRIGRIKFWALVLLPVVYFMSYYVTLYEDIYPESAVTQALSENFAIPILLGSISSIACGILFGIGFLSIAKSVSMVSRVKENMIITGFGFILFFVTGAATVLQAAYPPFGLPNVSMVGLSAYLIFFGLYNSAVGVANDVKLRQLMRKTLLDNSKLLDSIADAQMRQELEKTVLDMLRKNADKLENESGVPPAMTEDEMSQYLQLVIKEIGK